MANKKISQLPATSGAHATDVVPVVDANDGVSKKATLTQVFATLPAATTSTAGAMSAADKTKLDAAASAATASTLVIRDGSGNASFAAVTAAQVTVTGTPSSGTDAANKAYVDAVAVGLTVKGACRLATTANIANLATGAPSTLDGVSLSTSDRILVKDQSTASQNGIYTVTTVGSGSNGVWARATDADTGTELPTNSYVFINAGTVNSSTGWVMNTAGAITIGVSSIVWVLFSQITSLPAANITGQLIAAQIADAAINTAKFASGITPVEIVLTFPVTSNFEGRTVYLTSDDKIYRYTGTGWTSTTAATDVTGTLTSAQIASLAATKITGQITTTQITDGSIETPKLAAGAVTAAKITAGTITATELASGSVTTAKLVALSVTSNELAANSVIAGKVAAAAINTTELAAGAVNASKIAAGTITANEIAANTITAAKLNIASLSAISANIGTVTAGTITGVSITSTVGSVGGFALSTNKLYNSVGGVGNLELGTAGSGHLHLGDISGASGPSIELAASGGIIMRKTGGLSMATMDFPTGSSGRVYVANSSGNPVVMMSDSSGGLLSVYDSSFSEKVKLNGSGDIYINGHFKKITDDGWSPSLWDSAHDLEFRWNGTNLQCRVDHSSVLTITTT